MADPPFLVRFWGARGSIPCPADGHTKFGTETSCVEMRCGGRVLVFDSGSGTVGLSAQLMQEGVREFDLFFSHCHFDHIMGLPFLKPLFEDDAVVRIHAGHFEDSMTCREMAERFMQPPFFPITPKWFRARIEYRDFRPPAVLRPYPDIAIATRGLRHPNGCVGYRVDFAGKSVCYTTDVEHVSGEIDEALVELIRDADMIIYDCMYTDAEFDHYIGYGHSTWEHGVRLCEAAGVKRLVIFHHRPGRDDEQLQEIEAAAQARFPGAIVARTGLELEP
jgi:phosphoribosyl 1,2-cyclic phosphodiesterase